MKRHLANFVARLGARLVTAGFQAFSMVLIAREQGPSGFGLFAFGIALGAIIGAVCGLGSTTRAIRILREDEPITMASSLALLRIGSAVLVATGVAGVLSVSGSGIGIAISIGVIAAVDHICDYEQAVRAGLLQHRASTMVLLVQRGLPVAGVLAAWLQGWNTVHAYALAATVAVLVVGFGGWRRFDGDLDLRRAVDGFFGYWSGTVAQTMQQLDLPLVRSVAGDLGAGLYSAANRLVGVLGVVVNSAVVVLMPSLGQLSDEKRRRRIFLYIVASSAAFGCILAAASPLVARVVVVALGASYADATPIIVGVTIASGVGAVLQTLQSYLYIEGRASETAAINLVAVSVGLGVLVCSTAFWGVGWAWLGLLTNYSLVVVLLAVRIRRLWRRTDSSPDGCDGYRPPGQG